MILCLLCSWCNGQVPLRRNRSTGEKAAHPTPTNQWTWRDKDNRPRTKDDLDKILELHRVWLQTGGLQGSQADFSGSDLTNAPLEKANLSKAYFGMAKLTDAGLSGANLDSASMDGALIDTPYLYRTSFRGTFLLGSHLRGAALIDSNMTGAFLNYADLSDAKILGCNLTGVNLDNANLRGTDFSGSDLHEVNYQPAIDATPRKIAFAKNLGYIRYGGRASWESNSAPIYTLRRALREAGYDGASRQVNAAIHRVGERTLEKILFDWTCEWGANWVRPLELLLGMSIFSIPMYWFGLRFGRSTCLYVISTGKKIAIAGPRERAYPVSVVKSRRLPKSERRSLGSQPIPRWKNRWRSSYRSLAGEAVAFGTASLFSLMTTFNLGFHDLALGRWLRLLQSRDFDLRAKGWMRVYAGVQSLVGLGLVALSLLSYFGHPFE
jgi:hypothetical protein